MTVNYENALGYMKKWQPILRLSDWDITLEMIDTPWRKSGDIKIDTANRMAALLLNAHPVCTNTEEVVIHELLHLRLWAMDQMIESLINVVYGKEEDDPKRTFAYDQFMEILEPTVQDLTKGYLALGGEDPKPCGGRLIRQVEKEKASESPKPL